MIVTWQTLTSHIKKSTIFLYLAVNLSLTSGLSKMVPIMLISFNILSKL